jgi:UDP:flavonoid glycosyltransferase YjiC (YdhE family)
MSQGKAIVAVVSARGGGDKPPLLVLASALRDRGYEVHLLCDGDVADAVAPARLPVIHLPRSLSRLRSTTPYTFHAWRNEESESKPTRPIRCNLGRMPACHTP